MKLSLTTWNRFSRTLASTVSAVICTALIGFPATSLSQEFECAAGEDRRFIRLELPGEEHLCEVSVTKRDQSRQVMWYANNETLFCSAKIYELRGKYENQWGFTCTEWLDTGGIDRLSERHRSILDAELKALIRTGEAANPPYRITGVKAVASNPLNLASGTLALQYFMREEGTDKQTDRTHVLFDDGSEWRSIAELKPLTGYIDPSDKKDTIVTSALVHEITDTGVLHVNTTTSGACQGSQSLQISEEKVAATSPHLVLCNN